MMKNYIIYMFAITCLFFTACETQDTLDVSNVTFYPNLSLNGDATMYVESGTTFDDPGVTATIQGEDVPFEIVGNVDTSTPGIYNLSYEAVNDDGFTASAARTVFVYEGGEGIAGFYEGSTGQSSGNPVLISSTSDPNVFTITDILGGNYEFGRGYGPAYRTTSTITVNGTSVTSPGGSNAFGNWGVENASYDPSTQTFNWDSPLIGQGFALTGITLQKTQP